MKYTKTFAVKTKTNKEKNEVTAIASTDSVDLAGDVVLPDGLDLSENYAGTPILWAHNHDLPAIGNMLWIKPDANEVISKYRLHRKTQLSDDIFTLMDLGVIRSHSIGFDALEVSPPTPEEIKARPDWQDCQQVIRKWRLIELSVCNVPMNPDCVAVAIEKGVSRDTLNQLEKCCEWEDEKKDEPKPDEPQVESPAPGIYIVTPKYLKRWVDVRRDLHKRLNINNIIDRLHGRA